jgi:type 2 lantibiotic (TIGR03893 family)
MNNEKNKNNQNNVVSGVAFDDLTVAEMAEVQGAGDMEGETTKIALILVIVLIASTNTGCNKKTEEVKQKTQIKKELLLLEEGNKTQSRKEIKVYDIDDKNGILFVLTTKDESYYFSNYIVKEKVIGENVGSVIIETKLQSTEAIE